MRARVLRIHAWSNLIAHTFIHSSTVFGSLYRVHSLTFFFSRHFFIQSLMHSFAESEYLCSRRCLFSYIYLRVLSYSLFTLCICACIYLHSHLNIQMI